MFPNLLGQKAYHHMSNEEMAKIINVSRASYEKKIENGKFNVFEIQAYCKHFGKDFEYLFAVEPRTPNQ